MTFSGGDPQSLRSVAHALVAVGEDLAVDATELARLSRSVSAHAGDAVVSEVAAMALAAIGGAVVGASVIVFGLSQGADTAGSQLLRATGAAS